LNSSSQGLASEDGYVDTGDLVELEADRYYFRGRKGGIINVGGLKVYPEEVEGVINTDPRVAHVPSACEAKMPSWERWSSPRSCWNRRRRPADRWIRNDLLEACRRMLPAHKVPARLSFVPALELTAAGKLVAPGA